MLPKETNFNANMLSRKQKEQFASTGQFTGANNVQKGAGGVPISNLPTSISANELVNPPAKVTPPVPRVNTNDGSNTRNLINNVAAANQQIIGSDLESRKNADEMNRLIGEQTINGAEQRSTFNNQFGVPDLLARRQDIQTQLAQANTASELQKTQIQGAAGQTLGQAQREVTQQDRENAVRTAGLAAEAAVLQGSIETASTLVNQAMQDYYQDRQLKNQNMIQQLDYFSGIADKETAQLLQKEQRKYEEDQVNISRAVNSVNAAVSTGMASNKDIETMTSLAGNPTAQKEYADKIISNSVRRDFNLRMAEIAAARASAAQQATSEADAAVKTSAVSTQAAVDTIGNIRNNPLGIKAITGVGLGRTSLSAGLEAGGTQGFLAGTGVGAAAGTVVPGAGTVFGGALGGVLGFTAGAAMGTLAAASQRTNVASDLSYLVNEATFAEMRRLKASGVTFGALTEGERVAIGRAADNLFSALDVSPDGTVNGVKTTEDKFLKMLDDYEEKRLIYQEELNRSAAGLDDNDYQAIERAGQ